MKTLNKKSKLMLVAALIMSGTFAFTSLHATEEDAKKDGIKSSTTGNCWDTGKQCKKDDAVEEPEMM